MAQPTTARPATSEPTAAKPTTARPKTKVAAVEGWFTLDPVAPALLGSKCRACGTYAFPAETLQCRNPECQSTAFDQVELSRRGRVWSYTDARYQPPPPYVATDPFEPFALAAVELADEKMVVLGQVVRGVGVDDLRVGTEVELVLDTLYEDDEHEYLVWKWRPLSAGTSGTTAAGTAGTTAPGGAGA